MSAALELLFQLVFEIVLYGVGRAVLLVFAPHIGVESQTKQAKSSSKWWDWRGFSFMHNGKRYLYLESVQLVGLATIVSLIVLVVLANKYLK